MFNDKAVIHHLITCLCVCTHYFIGVLPAMTGLCVLFYFLVLLLGRNQYLQEEGWRGSTVIPFTCNLELNPPMYVVSGLENEINDHGGSAALTTRHPSIRRSWH
jgi:hypothetical protein